MFSSDDEREFNEFNDDFNDFDSFSSYDSFNSYDSFDSFSSYDSFDSYDDFDYEAFGKYIIIMHPEDVRHEFKDDTQLPSQKYLIDTMVTRKKPDFVLEQEAAWQLCEDEKTIFSNLLVEEAHINNEIVSINSDILVIKDFTILLGLCCSLFIIAYYMQLQRQYDTRLQYINELMKLETEGR